MRFLTVFLVALSLIIGGFSAPVLAQKIPPGQVQKIKTRIAKLSPAERKETIKVLDAKLWRLRRKVKLTKLARQRALLNAEIERVTLELELLRAIKVTAPPPSRPVVPPGQVKPVLKPQPRPKPLRPRSPQFGLSAGYISGIPGILGEVRFFEPLDLISTSLRVGAAYAQGEDSDGDMRKHALIVLDGIYHLTPFQTKGIRSYFGLGLNYDAYTTGKKTGSLGGGAFYGVEGGGLHSGQIFFEIGYGTIRTGFSPNYMGITALLGYKF